MKPLLLYDGSCGFCSRWIARWRVLTLDRVDYQPYQEAQAKFPQITNADFEKSVFLIEDDGRKISKAAEAVLKTLSYRNGLSWLYWMYRYIPGFKIVSEWMYRWVAEHRYML